MNLYDASQYEEETRVKRHREKQQQGYEETARRKTRQLVKAMRAEAEAGEDGWEGMGEEEGRSGWRKGRGSGEGWRKAGAAI